MPFNISADEKTFLLKLARETVLNYLNGEDKKTVEYFSDNLKTKSGAFVTLHKKGDLRGCIGFVEGYKPLQEAIRDLALSAAFNDPRFSPLSRDEYREIDLEISVLTPLEQISDLEDIKIGRDGLLIKQGYHEGLLLPQVAAEYKWDRETFLQQTCRKAGLPEHAYEEPQTEIYSFSAIIFSENDDELR